MTTAGRTLVVTAGCTAALGVVAFVSGSAWVAALAGLCALATASVALRSRDAVVVLEPSVPPEPDAAAVAPAEPDHPPETARATPAADARLLDEATLRTTLVGRIAIARRALRPLSVIHMEVADADGDGRASVPAEVIAVLLDTTLRESDACGRRKDGVYVFILEDTGEDGAVWTAERLRRKLTTVAGGRRFCAGIASYPNHGLDADAIDEKAAIALTAAKAWRRDRIEVATAN